MNCQTWHIDLENFRISTMRLSEDNRFERWSMENFHEHSIGRWEKRNWRMEKESTQQKTLSATEFATL